MTRRKMLPVIAGAMALSLAACSGGSDAPNEGTDPPEAAGPADLRMTVWTANEDQLALFDEIAKEYIDANPDAVASVSFEPLPFEDYTTTLTTQIAGGNAPDLAWIFENTAPEFVTSGALAELSQTLKDSEGYDYDDLLSEAMDLWSTDDGLYAYPFSNSPFVMFVNTDRIAEAGQPNPGDLVASGEWTYDAAREIAADSVDAIGGAGLVVRDFDFGDWSNLSTVWAGWDAAPWSADGLECTFDSPEMVDAMTWFHEAIFTDKAHPGPGSSVDFFAGDVTLTITQISRASALDGSFEWDVVPLPAGPVKQQNVIGQAGIGVLAKGAAPAVAADFLAFFTNPKNAARLATYFPPPRASLLTPEGLAGANPLLSTEQLQMVADSIDGGMTKPAHVNYAEVATTSRAALDELWTANADVQAVLGNVCAAIDSQLNR